MKTLVLHPSLGVLRFLLAALAALAATLASGFLLQGFNPFPVPDHPGFVRLLIGESLVVGPALLYLIERSRFSGFRLLGLALVVYIGSAQILAHLETLAFNALFQFGPAQLVYLVGSQALTALILVPLVVTVAGKWKAPAAPEDDGTGPWLPGSPVSLGVRVALLSVLWYLSYMAAGFFIADPITHEYYAAKMDNLAAINLWLPFLQILRGLLWTLLFVLAVRLMNRPLGEAGLVAGLLFGVFHAAGLLLPSPWMPDPMRLSHLPEIVLSLVWQGTLTVAILAWRPRPRNKP